MLDNVLYDELRPFYLIHGTGVGLRGKDLVGVVILGSSVKCSEDKVLVHTTATRAGVGKCP